VCGYDTWLLTVRGGGDDDDDDDDDEEEEEEEEMQVFSKSFQPSN
jgi:hypothetical protein